MNALAPVCPIWKSFADVDQHGDLTTVLSPRAGGRYQITGTAAAIVETYSPRERAKVTTFIVDQNRFNAVPIISSDNLNTLRRARAIDLEARVTRLLEFFARSSSIIGKPVHYSVGSNNDNDDSTASEVYAWTEPIESDEVEFLIKYLKDAGLVEENSWGGGKAKFRAKLS